MKQQIENRFFKTPREIYKLGLSLLEIVVLNYLISYNNFDQNYPSRELIAKECGIKSLRTLDKAIKLLKNKGFINYKKGKKGICNEYNINFNRIDSKCVYINEKNKMNNREIEKFIQKIFENDP